ncbi:efflux RND transporter periplasmic adaptor subunit [Paraburkholderia sp. PREW-6R]|uniref:efflux RND transporter periplasmic adaptor subunit n=1 Tax=Paraburkholderia sp. PREW-6R TaxID=3141544 RepID=UPI0031F531D3
MMRHVDWLPGFARPGSAVTSRLAAALTLTGLGLSLLAACTGKDPATPAVQSVVAITVHASTPAQQFQFPASIDARNSTALSFRIGGTIVERRVGLGARVRPGDVLARLDASDLETQAVTARAQLVAARAHVGTITQQLERDRSQVRNQLISQAQFEQTSDAYSAAYAQLEQARTQLTLAEHQIRYATLVADHAGVISAEFAGTGQNVTAGQPVYNLVWAGGMDAICDVPETVVAGLHAGDPATISVLALPDQPLRARVREFAPAADPQTRTYRVKLGIDDPPAALLAGMTASVALASPDNDAPRTTAAIYRLPATALFHDGPSAALWIVTPANHVLELRRVQIGRFDTHTIDVTSGLNEGETVVVQGVHTVTEGQPVRILAPLHEEPAQP